MIPPFRLLVGQSVGLSLFSKEAGSNNSMLLSENLFLSVNTPLEMNFRDSFSPLELIFP